MSQRLEHDFYDVTDRRHRVLTWARGNLLIWNAYMIVSNIL